MSRMIQVHVRVFLDGGLHQCVGWGGDVCLKRLVKQKSLKRIARSESSKPSIALNGFLDKGGLYYEYDVRLLGKRPIFSVVCYDTYDVYGLYDGEDFEKSFEFFCELSMALNGVNYAENFAKTKNDMQKRVQQLIDNEQTDMSLKKKPLFLGDSDFAIC